MAHRPIAQFDPTTEQELLDLVRERRQQPSGRRRAPKRGYGNAGGGAVSGATVESGVVESGTAATSTKNGNDLTLGELNVWKYLVESELDRYDPDETYLPDKPVRLGADAHDGSSDYDEHDVVHLTAPNHNAETAYAEGDLMQISSAVYRANGTVETGPYTASQWDLVADAGIYQAPAGGVTAGPFDAAEWDSIGSGGVWFAATTVTPGAWSASDWDEASGDRYIDRTRPTIRLDNHYEGDAPVEGALVKWIGSRLIGFTCEAQAGWS